MWIFIDNQVLACMWICHLTIFAIIFYDASVHDDVLFPFQMGNLPF